MAQVFAGLCPEHLHTGNCHAKDCKFDHKFRFCPVCAVLCSAGQPYEDHLIGRQHKDNLDVSRRAFTWLKCPTCLELVFGEATWSLHIQSPAHVDKAVGKRRSPYEYPLDPTSKHNSRFCLVCRRTLPNKMMKRHPQTDFHKKMEQAAHYRAQLEQAEKDRPGITVSHLEDGVDFGVVSPEKARKGLEAVVMVTMSPTATTRVVQVEAKSVRLNVKQQP